MTYRRNTRSGVRFVARLGLLAAAATMATACGSDVDYRSTVTLSQIAEIDDATLVGNLLTIEDGQIVQVSITGRRVEDPALGSPDTSSIDSHLLALISDNASVAEGFWHQGTRFAIVGHEPGQATLTIVSGSGKVYGRMRVEVVAQ